MLARRFSLSHQHAGEIEMPLLVPAFSSKGFRMLSTGHKKGEKRNYSEISQAFLELSPSLSTCVLVSAYDVHFRYLWPPNVGENAIFDALSNARVVFLDSGGYELNDEFDSTENKTPLYAPVDGYGVEEYKQVIDRFQKAKQSLHLIVSNFDFASSGTRLQQQIETARSIFADCPGALTDFIIKPVSSNATYVNPEAFSKTDFRDLGDFNIIGITEKELGRNLIDKLQRLRTLRRGLSEANVSAPIHVWGGLEPTITPLFFFAGAEVFDGVSWLRYSFQNGVAICRQAYQVLEPKVDVRTKVDIARMLTFQDNLLYMDALSSQLQQWVDCEGRDFSMFHPAVRKHFERAWKTMITKFKDT